MRKKITHIPAFLFDCDRLCKMWLKIIKCDRTHITAFLFDCDSVKPNIVKIRYQMLSKSPFSVSHYEYICHFSLPPLKNLTFNCFNRLQFFLDASGDHGHGLEKCINSVYLSDTLVDTIFWKNILKYLAKNCRVTKVQKYIFPKVRYFNGTL